MAKKLKIAIVGCGRVSRTAHYQTVQDNPDYDFVAVCDIDRSRADEWATKYGVKAYYRLETLLEQEELDLVSINVPNGRHPQLATKVAAKGVHVIVEKPLATSLLEAENLIDCCEDAGVELFVVLQNRYNATNQLLKACVDKGRFGRISSCHVNLYWHRELSYYTEDHGWRSRRDLSGGVFTNQAVHYVDMLQWIVGSPPETAYAKMGTAGFSIDVEDHGVGVIKFSNGVIGSLNLSNLTFPKDLEGSITILGEKGTVKIGGTCMNKIEIWEFSESAEEDQLIKEAETSPPTVYGFGHITFYEKVANYLLRGAGETEVITGREGIKSVALLEGLYLSNQLAEEVRFPLANK